MKLFRSLVSLVLSLGILVCSGSAFAADIRTDEIMEATGQAETLPPPVGLADIEDAIAALTSGAESISIDQATPVTSSIIPDIALEDNTSLAQTQSAINMNTRSTNFYFEDTLAATGDSKYVFPITLGPKQILQVSMECPLNRNLDYDLYLYEFNPTTQTLGALVDASTYRTYFNYYSDNISRTLDEGVDIINTTTANKSYALRVHSKVGGSATDPFKLTLSLDFEGNYNAGETDQNAFAVCMDVPLGQSINGIGMNSPADNDWFGLNIPADGFEYAKVSVVAGSYMKEIYRVSSNQMVLVSDSQSGNYSLSPGYYYIRVLGKKSNFVAGVYSLSVQLNDLIFPAEKIVITGYDSENGPNDYPYYKGYGQYYRFKGDTLTVKGQLSSNSGYPAKKDGIGIKATWKSGHWPEGHEWNQRWGHVGTDKDGKFSITLTGMPPSAGIQSLFIPGAISFTHYFDLSGVLVEPSNNYPLAYAVDTLFHFSHSVYQG